MAIGFAENGLSGEGSDGEPAAGPLAGQILRRLAERDGSAVLRTAGRLRRSQPAVLTGSEVRHRVQETAARLLAALDGRAPVLVLALPAGEPFITALLASLLAGITAVPVALPRAGGHGARFARIAADSGAGAVLCAESDRTLIGDTLREGRAPVPVLTLEHLPEAEPLAEGPARRPGRPAVIQYTSGSSRFPYGVALTDETILANAALVARRWRMDKRAVVVNWLPHFHDMGLLGGILYPLLAGGISIQMNPLEMIQRPVRWLQAISEHRAGFSGGPTFAYERCLEHIGEADCAGLDLASWAVAFCGAEPVHAAVLERFRRRFARYGLAGEAVHACYGLAEYTLFAAGERGEPSGTGRPVPDGCARVEPCLLAAETRRNIRIVDPGTRRPLADGSHGEIWLRGPSRAAGYVGRPGESAETFEAGTADGPPSERWLRTGDLGVIADDALYVTGRLKDTLTVNGRKVSAPELEWLAAAQHDDLNPLAAAAFMPDPMASGHAVLLIEFRSRSAEPDGMAAVRERIFRAVLGEWGIALDDIRFLPRGSLDRTTSGKIRRTAIAAAYRSNFIAGQRIERQIA